jgi:hypothetical protein
MLYASAPSHDFLFIILDGIMLYASAPSHDFLFIVLDGIMLYASASSHDFFNCPITTLSHRKDVMKHVF